MKKKILLFGLFVFTFSGLFAQPITLEQVRSLALANSRSLAKYNLSIQGNKLDERSQLYTMLPTLSADYSASVNYLQDWKFVNPVDTFDSSARLSVTQIIFAGGKNLIQQAISELSSESTRKDAQAEYFNVLNSADNAYYAVLEAAATLEAAESALESAVSNLAIAEIRQANGMINQSDYLKALADNETKVNSRNQARRNLSLNMTKLKSLIGASGNPQPEQIDFSGYEDLIQRLGSISDGDAGALYDSFWQILSKANPSLAKAALNNQKAEKNLSLTKRDPAPKLSATIFTGSIGYSAVTGFGKTSRGGVALTGTIPLDFWVFADRIEKSKIAVESAKLDYISTETQLETDLQSALINSFTQAEAVLSSRRSLAYTQKNFEFVQERYRLSQSSVSDLGDASSLLITSRNNLIKANFGFLQSLSTLRSLGVIDDEQKLVNILMGS